MNKVRPVFIELMLGGVIVFTVGITIMLADMYVRICSLEHAMIHASAPSRSCTTK